MKTIRTFVAIKLSDEARTALNHLQDELKSDLPPRSVRWTKTQNLHLTLHFLGNVALDKVDILKKMFEAGGNNASFRLNIAGLGTFPHFRRPRIIWTGISGQTDSLLSLHQQLGARLHQAIGFEPEKRPYSPHLTIGRVAKRIPKPDLSRLGQLLEQKSPTIKELAVLPVGEVVLMQSDFKPGQRGVTYTPLAREIFSP